MIQIYHLSAPGCSGRAIKVRELSANDVDQCSVRASKLIGAGATAAEFGIAKSRELCHGAIVAVSGPAESVQEALSHGFEKVTPQVLESPGPFNYQSLFNAKDDQVITSIVNRIHFVSADDIEKIVGKALAVSED